MSALERLLGEFDAQPAQSSARLAAAQALRAHSLPTRREENWRYANLRALESVVRFRPAVPLAPGTGLPPLPAALAGYTRLVFVDGLLSPAWPLPALAPIIRVPVAAALAADSATLTYETTGDGRMGLIARMFAPDPLALQIAGSASLELIYLTTPGAAGGYTEIVVEIAADARVSLVERHLGCHLAAAPSAAAAALNCSNLRLQLGAGAQLQHTRLQQAAGNALYYDTLTATLGERASYGLAHIAAGGGSDRSSALIRLQGRDASVQIRALAAARGSEVSDVQFAVLHEAPGTRSDQLFRGIASDHAHIACSADVQVLPGAPGTRVLQSLRGLIDGKGAAVNLRPRLTINTDDIQAAHGATTGRLDENLLFYLLSRGLEPAAARSLLKWALLGEAFAAIEPPALRRAAEVAAAARLSDAPATELLQ